jgi:hypothetical protein
MTTVPIIATLGVERGFRFAFIETGKLLFTGGPLYFTFHMATKAHFFEQTILAGDAKYRPTGRGLVTRHEAFAEIYRFHAMSHFTRSFEIAFILIVEALFDGRPLREFASATWLMWLIVVAWSFAPFWFNPLGLQFSAVMQDVSDWYRWMIRQEGPTNLSWLSWWNEETSYMQRLSTGNKIILAAFSCRFALLGVGILLFHQTEPLETLICFTVIVFVMIVLMSVKTKTMADRQHFSRIFKAFAVVLAFTSTVTVMIGYHLSFIHLIVAFVGLTLIAAAAANVLHIAGIQSNLLTYVHQLYHFFLAGTILAPLCMLALLQFPAKVQTRLTFHNAFSKGVVIEDLLKRNTSRHDAKNTADIEALQQTIRKQQEQIEALLRKGQTLHPAGQLEKTTSSSKLKDDSIPIPRPAAEEYNSVSSKTPSPSQQLTRVRPLERNRHSSMVGSPFVGMETLVPDDAEPPKQAPDNRPIPKTVTLDLP